MAFDFDFGPLIREVVAGWLASRGGDGTSPPPGERDYGPEPSPFPEGPIGGRPVPVPSPPDRDPVTGLPPRPIVPRPPVDVPTVPIPEVPRVPTPTVDYRASVPFLGAGLGYVSPADVYGGQPRPRPRAPSRRPARRRAAPRPRTRPARRTRPTTPPRVPRPSSPRGVPIPRSTPAPLRVAYPFELLRRLWDEYLRPQPQGDPNARTRPGTSKRVPRRNPRGPIFPGIPSPRAPSPTPTPQRGTRPSTTPRTAAPEIWGTPAIPPVGDPFVRTPGTRAPGRPNPVPSPSSPREPAFPWPRQLLPFNPNVASPSPQPRRSPSPRPRTRPQPTPLTQPQPTPVGSPLTPVNPGMQPSPEPTTAQDPCSAAANERRREQRRRRKQCKKFTYKRIKVCQSSSAKSRSPQGR